MNKENRFEWKDYDDHSALYCGDKYIATVNYNENIYPGFMLSLSVEHTHYSNHNLYAANLDEAKQKAGEIIAAEYERAIGQARTKLKKYEALALGLAELQYETLITKRAIEYASSYGSTEKVVPKLNSYVDNNNLYLGLDYFDNELKAWLPYTDVTVNVGKLPYLESAIDTNNNDSSIITFLEKNGFGHHTGSCIKSGYCAFPVFKFNEDKLKEVDNENFALYAAAHSRDFRSLDDTIKEAKGQGAAVTGTDKDKTKEPSFWEAR